MKRRVFVEYTGKLAVLGGCGLVGCSEDDPQPDLGNGLTVDLDTAPFDVLQEAGNWLLHPDINVILVNFEGDIRAFTSVCTHNQCSRRWVFGSTEATCTCHGSKYDVEGRVIQGPAQKDLTNFNVAINGSTLTITE